MANAEDGCTGRFWEGRFKSQALLDEKALIACMAYVDLNPIRARMADTPETSAFTSIQQRISAARAPTHESRSSTAQHPSLLNFTGRHDDEQGLPYALTDYLALVDWSGRAIHPAKRGSIDDTIPPILERLDIEHI